MFSKLPLFLVMLGAVDAFTCADGDGNGNAATCSSALSSFDRTELSAATSHAIATSNQFTSSFFFGGGTKSGGGDCAGDPCTNAECCTACDDVVGGAGICSYCQGFVSRTGICGYKTDSDSDMSFTPNINVGKMTPKFHGTIGKMDRTFAKNCGSADPNIFHSNNRCNVEANCKAKSDVGGQRSPGIWTVPVTCTAAGNSQLVGNCETGKYKLAGTATTCLAIEPCHNTRSVTIASVDGASNNVCSACPGGTFAVGNAACSGTCDVVTNAATVTCSAAGNSVVATCDNGFWKNGNACTACDAVTNAVTVTCSAAGNSVAATCDNGYWKNGNACTMMCDAGTTYNQAKKKCEMASPLVTCGDGTTLTANKCGITSPTDDALAKMCGEGTTFDKVKKNCVTDPTSRCTTNSELGNESNESAGSAQFRTATLLTATVITVATMLVLVVTPLC